MHWLGERAKFWNERALLNDHVFKRPRIQDFHRRASEVLECARAFKRTTRLKDDVFRISIDYILELLARFARSPNNNTSCLSQYCYNYRTQLVFTAVIRINQFCLASWIKREELMVPISVEHLYDAILMHIHVKIKADNTVLTDIAEVIRLLVKIIIILNFSII